MRHESRQAYERAQFAALRSLLQSRPGPEAWPQVCKLAQAWRGEAFEEVERYIEDHIQGWPDAARELPRRWRVWIMRGEDVPQARLARSLSVGAAAQLHRVWTCPHLTHISHLSIDGLPLPFGESAARVEAFIARQEVQLEHVTLRCFVGEAARANRYERQGVVWQNTIAPNDHPEDRARWDALLVRLPTRTLRLSLPAPDHTISTLSPDTPLAAHLEVLEVSSWMLHTGIVHALSTESLPRLHTLRVHIANDLHLSRQLQRALRALLDDPRLDPRQRQPLTFYAGG